MNELQGETVRGLTERFSSTLEKIDGERSAEIRAELSSQWGDVCEILDEVSVALAGSPHDLLLQERLRDSYVRLYDHAPVGYLMIDEHGVVMQVNQAFCGLLEMSPVSLIGRQFTLLLHTDDREMFTRWLYAAKDSSSGHSLDLRLLRSDDKILFVRLAGRLEEHPLLPRTFEYKSLLLSVSDISDLTQATEQLQVKSNEMRRFTYTLSHELKTPIVTLRSFLGFLRRDVERGDAESILEDCRFLDEAVVQMETRLAELLRLLRYGMSNGGKRLCLFSSLLDETLAGLREQFGQRQVEVVIVGAELPLQIDPNNLGDILQNLLDNAIRFLGDQPRPRIEVGWEADLHGHPVFFVRDNGIGIEPKFQSRIFNLFERLDPGQRGTGLGLALVGKIVTMYQGDIWVESEGAGKGSCFRFTLPAAQTPKSVEK